MPSSIDEVGFPPFDRHQASLPFRLMRARYEKGSILINTNKAIHEWPEVLLGDEVVAFTPFDRLLHRFHLIDINGRSYRIRDLERLVQKRRPGVQTRKLDAPQARQAHECTCPQSRKIELHLTNRRSLGHVGRGSGLHDRR